MIGIYKILKIINLKLFLLKCSPGRSNLSFPYVSSVGASEDKLSGNPYTLRQMDAR